MNNHVQTAEFEGASPPPTIGEVIAKKYHVDSIVGTGGMGVVLAATHMELGQKVAIKVLTVSEDDTRRDEARERFLREGRATAALVSDHVVRVHDLGTLETGAPFLVMELLRGRDLAVVLAEGGALPIEQAADFVRQAAEGIACAHAQGIVHRDLKPSNLFLTQRSDGSALIKVLDFGISKAMHSELEPVTGNLTAARSVLGTPFYMSPEQVRDAKKVDYRTDIWSLGLILHELLAGSPAFTGSTLPSVCAAIAADAPAALRLKRPEVPVELEAIVLKCLQKDPLQRFSDTRDLIAKLLPWTGRAESGAMSPLSDATIRSSSLELEIAELRDGSTVTLPPNDPGTMASARLTQSGERQIFSDPAIYAKHDATLAEAPGSLPFEEPASPLALPSTEGKAASSKARSGVEKRAAWPMIGGAALLLTALGVFALRGSRVTAPIPVAANPAQPAARVPTQAPASAAFALQIESSPAGAEVYEGDQLLGTTPLHIAIDASSVALGPRTFSVHKAGFYPYTLVQGASATDTRTFAQLAAEPAAVSPAPPSAKKKPLGQPKAPKAHAKAADGAPDIFMQR